MTMRFLWLFAIISAAFPRRMRYMQDVSGICKGIFLCHSLDEKRTDNSFKIYYLYLPFSFKEISKKLYRIAFLRILDFQTVRNSAICRVSFAYADLADTVLPVDHFGLHFSISIGSSRKEQTVHYPAFDHDHRTMQAPSDCRRH